MRERGDKERGRWISTHRERERARERERERERERQRERERARERDPKAHRLYTPVADVDEGLLHALAS